MLMGGSDVDFDSHACEGVAAPGSNLIIGGFTMARNDTENTVADKNLFLCCFCIHLSPIVRHPNIIY